MSNVYNTQVRRRANWEREEKEKRINIILYLKPNLPCPSYELTRVSDYRFFHDAAVYLGTTKLENCSGISFELETTSNG